MLFLFYLGSYFHYLESIVPISRTKLMPSDGKGYNLSYIRIYFNLRSYRATWKVGGVKKVVVLSKKTFQTLHLFGSRLCGTFSKLHIVFFI